MGALEVVAFLSVSSSQLFNLASLPSIIEIRRARSTLAYTAEPFIAGLLSGWINFCYAFAAWRLGVLVSVALSTVFNTFYFLTHVRFSKVPACLIKTLGQRFLLSSAFLFSVPIVALLLLSSATVSSVIAFWFGVNSMLLGCYVNLAQLVNLPAILRQRNSASISPPLSVATLFSCICWTTYGAMLGDVFYVVTNAIGVASALAQLGLVLVLPRTLPVAETAETADMSDGSESSRRDSQLLGMSVTCSSKIVLGAQARQFEMELVHLFAMLGMLSTQLFNLASLPSAIEIIKNKSTLSYGAESYIAGLLAGWVSFSYAFMASRAGVIFSLTVTATFNLLYFVVHVIYSKESIALLKSLGVRLAMLTLFLSSVPITALATSEDGKEDEAARISMIWLGFNYLILASYANITDIISLSSMIRDQNVASLSPYVTAAILCNSSCWLIYGLLVRDAVYVVVNSLGLISGLIQVYLLIKYPRIHPGLNAFDLESMHLNTDNVLGDLINLVTLPDGTPGADLPPKTQGAPENAQKQAASATARPAHLSTIIT